MKSKRKLIWSLGLAASLAYVVSAPFVYPHVYSTPVLGELYTPVTLSLNYRWFGRPVVAWYFYDVCHMNLFFSAQ
jgi:hypothetical protein